MKNLLLFVYITAILTLFIGKAQAIVSNSTDRVVAVVSGSVITQHDLDQRVELLKRQIRQQIPKQQLPAVYRKTLNDLVNEEVQKQYAASQSISVEDSELNLAIAEIEKRNGWQHGAFYTMVNGLEATAKNKVKSELLRNKIVSKKLRPRVVIAKGEIDRLITNINNNKNNIEKKVYQIFIEHGKEPNDPEAKKHIWQIYKQLKNDKTQFHSIAETYTQSDDAKQGEAGLLGWFGTGELTPSLDETLTKLTKGDISEPISTPNGWHILYVEDTKEAEKFSTEPITEYHLFKYQISLNESENKKALEKNFKKEVKSFERLGDMEEMTLRHKKDKAYKGSGSLGWVSTSNLNSNMQEMLSDMDINEFSNIIEMENTLTVYHLTDKREVLPKKVEEYRSRLYGRLLNNRLELAAKRFMRDLRRQAYVEIRL